MAKLRIKNFGPIKEGYLENDGWMDIDKVTVLIGNQGSGKSTVAKVFSTFSWLEKALIAELAPHAELLGVNSFKDRFQYHRVSNYFKKGTELEYEGTGIGSSFINEKFNWVSDYPEGDFLYPQIMYIPSERNFVASVDNPSALKYLPPNLFTFLDEFEVGMKLLPKELELPISNLKFQKEGIGNSGMIKGDNYTIRLAEASSGLQSLIPLILVSDYLSKLVHGKIVDRYQNRSLFRSLLEVYLEHQKNNSTDDFDFSDFGKSRLFSYQRFLNIVEEPEQNLYPSSQRHVLNALLEYNQVSLGNQLLMTTHSPYLVNFLSLAVQGFHLKEKIDRKGGDEEALKRLSEIVPIKSLVDPKGLNIYELNDDGSISKLPDYEGIPSDGNKLNQFLREGNELFDALLEIEQSL